AMLALRLVVDPFTDLDEDLVHVDVVVRKEIELEQLGAVLGERGRVADPDFAVLVSPDEHPSWHTHRVLLDPAVGVKHVVDHLLPVPGIRLTLLPARHQSTSGSSAAILAHALSSS